MKTLNIQITLSTYQKLSDNEQLNPSFISGVLYDAYADYGKKLPKEIKQPTVKYALKINSDVHQDFKRSALDNQVTLSELSGRLFEKYYKDVK